MNRGHCTVCRPLDQLHTHIFQYSIENAVYEIHSRAYNALLNITPAAGHGVQKLNVMSHSRNRYWE